MQRGGVLHAYIDMTRTPPFSLPPSTVALRTQLSWAGRPVAFLTGSPERSQWRPVEPRLQSASCSYTGDGEGIFLGARRMRGPCCRLDELAVTVLVKLGGTLTIESD